MSHYQTRMQRGVSLVEALVAFAVLAFGLLGVVGMQSTMRSNADLARQRAEAVRLAQDAVEEWRGFSSAASAAAAPNRMRFEDVTGSATWTVAPNSTNNFNATYTISRQAMAPTATALTVTPAQRGIVVNVAWQDRTGQTQSVQLSSTVSGVEPELGASLVLSTRADPVVPPMGRHRAIPRSAVPLGIGRSGFVPPGQTGLGDRVAWVFDNNTAMITSCTTSANTTSQLTDTGVTLVCGADRASLLTGFVRFATDGLPSATSVSDPTGPLFPSFGVSVRRATPTPVTSFACFQDAITSHAVAYYCAVELTTSVKIWSGRVEFGTPLLIAPLVSSTSDSLFKVCRYHSDAAYTAVSAALTNQNFVIIKAGNGSVSFNCPTVGTPRTWAHNPSS